VYSYIIVKYKNMGIYVFIIFFILYVFDGLVMLTY
jgi:hypothetical protein